MENHIVNCKTALIRMCPIQPHSLYCHKQVLYGGMGPLMGGGAQMSHVDFEKWQLMSHVAVMYYVIKCHM